MAPNATAALSTSPAQYITQPLLAAVRSELTKHNARLSHFAIVDLAVVDQYRGSGYVIVGYGFADTARVRTIPDELFGVFAANDSLTRLWHTFEVMPARRGRDWTVRIVAAMGSHLIVKGHSIDYGETVATYDTTYLWPNDRYAP